MSESGEATATDPGQSGVENPEVGSSAAATPTDELVPISRVRDLQSSNDRLRNQLAELEGRVTAIQSEAETARSAAGSAQAESLGHLRRALLAEHRGQVVEELVAGDTAEALTASLEVARGAFSRVTEAARAQLQQQQVPAGVPARDGAAAAALESASPMEKIARGLEAKGGS